MLEYKHRYAPIMDFAKEGQLKEALIYWQENLFLTDWVIKVAVAKQNLFDPDLSDGELAGRNHFDIVLKCAMIYIRPHKKDDNPIMKNCDEQVLIHELLHCKYNWLAAPDSAEGKYFDVLEHSLLEQMSKTLIQVKYNLPFDWWYTQNLESEETANE